MKDRFKIFIIKFLLQFLVLFFKFEKLMIKLHRFFLKLKVFRLKVSILRLKLIRKRYYSKKLGCNFSVLDAIRELRYQINNVFGGSHV